MLVSCPIYMSKILFHKGKLSLIEKSNFLLSRRVADNTSLAYIQPRQSLGLC